MIVRVRPGRYCQAVMEVGGERRISPWYRGRDTLMNSWATPMMLHTGWKLLYVVNAIVRDDAELERPGVIDDFTLHSPRRREMLVNCEMPSVKP